MRIAIVDDNKDIQLQLAGMIHKIYKNDISIEAYSTGEFFLADIKEALLLPDIVFMDIEIGSKNGIDIVKDINQKLPLTQVIYISAFDDYYLDVYETRHTFFLKKPFKMDQVAKAMEVAMGILSIHSKEVFHFENNRKKYAVIMNNILYMESSRRKVFLYCANGLKYEFYGNLGKVMESLPSFFIRCHRSFIVNMNHITSQGRTSLVMINGESIPVSRSYSEVVKDLFIDHMIENI